MAWLAQYGNIVATGVVGILVWFYLRGRFEDQSKRINDLTEEIRSVRGELSTMRSDLTNVALAVGARPRASEA